MKIFSEKEKIKTLSIVVLFCITILLLYFIWEDSIFKQDTFSLNTADSEEKDEMTLNTNDFLEPFRLRINFGGGKYTVLYTGFSNVWDNFVSAYCESSQHEVYIEEILPSQWNEVLNYKSIKFDFGANIPFNAITDIMNANRTQANEAIEIFSSAAYSSVSPGSFFIYDDKNNKYYQIVCEKEYKDIFESISEIENRNVYDIYYPINTFFGVGNNNLMPHSLKNSIQEISGEQEIHYYETDKINAIAETFFGESFDFVRKIVETNGTVIYMYGYGQKMLIVDRKGFFEYKEEVTNMNNSSDSYLKSLSRAIDFVKDHGNWKTLNGTNIYPYLKNSIAVEKNNRTGYRFIFQYRINGYPVSYQGNNCALEVEVIGNRITYYKRYLLNQKDTLQYMTNNNQDLKSNIMSTVNILNNSYEYIKEAYIQEGHDFGEKTKIEIFNEVVGLINRVDVGYFSYERKQTEEEIQLIPVWIFTTDQYEFFFDARSGNPIDWNALR